MAEFHPAEPIEQLDGPGAMNPHPTLDQETGGTTVPAQSSRDWPGTRSPAGAPPVRFPAEDGGKSLADLAARDLNATLQLLAERAQYIAGATGAAIALRDGEEMVCRASAGSCAPEIGARLQTDSGLSGESVRTRQILRCDNAQADDRVNKESCEALGIASVVVMPMVEGGEVTGVFELFSDRPYAFEERDIIALERMGLMVRTALAQAEMAKRPRPAAESVAAVPANSPAEKAQAESTEAQSAPSVEEPSVAKETSEAARAQEAPEQSASTPMSQGAGASDKAGPREDVGNQAAQASAEDLTTIINLPSRIAFHTRVTRKPASGGAAAGPAVAPALAEEKRIEQPKPAWQTPRLEPISFSDGVLRDLVQAQPAESESPTQEPRTNATLVSESAATVAERSSENLAAEEAPQRLQATLAATEDRAAELPTLSFGTAVVPAALNPSEQAISTTSAEPTKGVARANEAKAETPEVASAGAQEPARVEEPAKLEKQTDSAPLPPQTRQQRAVASLKRCESCGFPVSEGRQLCLDCEKKKKSAVPKSGSATSAKPAPAAEPVAAPAPIAPAEASSTSTSTEVPAPQFLSGSPDHYESWIVSHMYAAVGIAVVAIGLIVFLLSR